MAMRDRWAEYPDAYGLHDLVDLRNDNYFRWVGHEYVTLPEPHMLGPVSDWVLPYNTRVIPLTDPFHVPALEKLISRSKKRTRGERRSTRATRSLELVSKASETTPIGLPLDIKQLILDELPHSIDAGNTATAFYWKIPDAYWKGRLPLDMIFELDGITPEGLDWQYLFIKYERLAKSSRALSNRQRISTILEGTRDRFFRLVECCDQN